MGTNRSGWISTNPNNDYYEGVGNSKNNFLSARVINQIGVGTLYNMLTSTSVLDDLQLLFNSPKEWVTDLIWYPFNIPYYDSQLKQYLKIGKVSTLGESYETECKIPLFLTNNELISLGNILIQPKFNNFMDFEGYTTIDVFLPFLGYVQVTPSDVMGKYLYIDLFIDYYSGQGIYYLSVSEDSDEDSIYRRIINKHSVQLGYKIPLGSTNALENSRNMILGSTNSIFRNISNPANIGTDLLNLATGMTTSATTEKTSNPLLDIASTKYVKVVIKRPTPQDINEDEYLKLYGKPLESTILLEDEKGFTKIEKINLISTTLTDDEKDELMNILKEGVIL